MDKIFIQGLQVFAYHGVNPEEKRDGQLFIADITAELDLTAAGESDNLAETVSYSALIKRAGAVLRDERYNLLETAALRVIRALLYEYRALSRVTVRLQKPQAPIRARFDTVGVEISRSREDLA
ncbi:MAG: dihydroneopterin aldolase [Clostridia bacterium]|nr:dihydroneopterin aldolase [Clostridia bacterium]